MSNPIKKQLKDISKNIEVLEENKPQKGFNPPPRSLVINGPLNKKERSIVLDNLKALVKSINETIAKLENETNENLSN
jgi:hypothetical protein